MTKFIILRETTTHKPYHVNPDTILYTVAGEMPHQTMVVFNTTSSASSPPAQHVLMVQESPEQIAGLSR